MKRVHNGNWLCTEVAQIAVKLSPTKSDSGVICLNSTPGGLQGVFVLDSTGALCR